MILGTQLRSSACHLGNGLVAPRTGETCIFPRRTLSEGIHYTTCKLPVRISRMTNYWRSMVNKKTEQVYSEPTHTVCTEYYKCNYIGMYEAPIILRR
jgi:hypothetical protein